MSTTVGNCSKARMLGPKPAFSASASSASPVAFCCSSQLPPSMTSCGCVADVSSTPSSESGYSAIGASSSSSAAGVIASGGAGGASALASVDASGAAAVGTAVAAGTASVADAAVASCVAGGGAAAAADPAGGGVLLQAANSAAQASPARPGPLKRRIDDPLSCFISLFPSFDR